MHNHLNDFQWSYLTDLIYSKGSFPPPRKRQKASGLQGY